LKIARGISDESDRSMALRKIAPELTWAGEFEKALEIARSISNEVDRSVILSDIASELAEAGEPYQHIFEEAMEIARSISDEEERSMALSDIASELVKAGEFEKAMEIARSISDDEHKRTLTLSGIASELAEAGEFEEAFKFARCLSNEEDRSVILSKIASGLAKTDELMIRILKETEEEGVIVSKEMQIKLNELQIKTKQAIDTPDVMRFSREFVNLVKGIKLKYGEARERIKAVRKEVDSLRNIGCNISDIEEMAKGTEGFFEKGEYDKAIELSKQVEKDVERIREKVRPEIEVDLPLKYFKHNYWKKTSLIVINKGKADAKNVKVTFSKEIVVKGLDGFDISSEEEKEISFFLKPIEKGEVPVEAEICYMGIEGEEYTMDKVFMINIGKKEAPE